MLRNVIMAGLLMATPTIGFGQAQFQTKVDGDFGDASMVWNGAMGKGYDARIKLILDKNGNLALCGIGRMTKIQLSNPINRSLRGGTLKVKGKTVIKDFRYFTKARRKAELTSGTATCRSSGVKPPSDLNAIDISYGEGSFRN